VKLSDLNALPEHVKRMIDHAQRQSLGIRTNDEVAARVHTYNERKLHAELRQLFNLKGIAYLEARMDRKSHMTKGWPDFTFAVLLQKPNKMDPTGLTCVPIPCAWECKVGSARLKPEQEEMLRRLQAEPNGWRVKVIHSLQEAVEELKALGI